MKIIVTGASKGIGYETAKLMVLQGHHVVAIARSRRLLEKLQKECYDNDTNSKIEILEFDLESSDYSALFAVVEQKLKEVDVLINNAGLLINKPFQQITLAELHKVYSVNVFSVFGLINALMPLFKKHAAHIVNISSMGGFQGAAKFSGLSAYSSSKGALSTLTECLAEELKPSGVAVNCLCLGAVQTEMLSEAFPGYKAPVTAAEMAAFITDFAIKGNKFFNGKILPVSLSTP